MPECYSISFLSPLCQLEKKGKNFTFSHVNEWESFHFSREFGPVIDEIYSAFRGEICRVSRWHLISFLCLYKFSGINYTFSWWNSGTEIHRFWSFIICFLLSEKNTHTHKQVIFHYIGGGESEWSEGSYLTKSKTN